MDDEIIEDRGDNWTPPAQATPTQTPVVEGKKDDDKVEEKDDKAEDQPRDEAGKFAKKDRGPEEEVRIPKSRFDEQVAKERQRAEEAERRLAAVEARLNSLQPKTEEVAKPDPVATQVETLEAKIEELQDKRDGFLVDGNTEKAAEARKGIRALERELRALERDGLRAEAEQIASRKLETQTEEQRIETVVSNLEGEFPVLRQGADEFDGRMVNLVMAEAERLAKEDKLSPHEALAKAGKDIMELFGHKSAAKAKDEPKSEPNPGEKRKAEALAKAIEVAKKQPQSIKEVGMDSDKSGKDTVNLDPNKLDDKEFASLTRDELAKMRGDFIEG